MAASGFAGSRARPVATISETKGFEMVTGHPANSGSAVDINPMSAVARNAQYDADAIAVHYAGGGITYHEFDSRVAHLAGAMLAGGVRPGDRVAYVGMNSYAFLVTMLTCFKLGAIFVPANFRLAPAELLRVLNSSEATVVVCEAGHIDRVDAIRAEATLSRFLLVDDDAEVPVAVTPGPHWESWADAAAAAEPVIDVVQATFDNPAILMFTSGTTGLPKGVILTYGNIWWNAVNVEMRLDTRRKDVTYAAAPLFHIGALNSFVIRTLVRGGTVVVKRSADPSQLVADIATYKVNSMFAVPAMLAPLSRIPDAFDHDLSSLRAVVVAGAPVPESLIRKFADHDVWLQQAWGLTETAPFATHLPIEMTMEKLGSAGCAMPYTEVRVVDLAVNEPVKEGVPGEVVVRGPNVTPGYWRNQDATDAAFDSEGWFHSGDIGYMDSDGYLFIVDRLKDMVITGGENVYPAEVERVLAAMPGVSDVAIIGVPDEKWGETVVAVVAVEDGIDIELDDVRGYAEAHLARYKLPRALRLVERVPRNPSGKIEKIKIRQMMELGGA